MTADPWALLREARQVFHEKQYDAGWHDEYDRLATRIDAALEAHAATPTPAMPEWTLWERLWDDTIIWKIRDFRQGVTLSVKPSRPTWGFYWSVKQFGQKPTEDEAKAAAVECARRLP